MIWKYKKKAKVNMILDEFENSSAVIEPGAMDTTVHEVCDLMILSFRGDLLDEISRSEKSRLGGYTNAMIGTIPWYIYEDKGLKVAVSLALLGAPALISSLEKLQAVGFKQFIIFGSCGVLDKNLVADHIIIPTSAIRDEGTSYHYAPASDEIQVPDRIINTISEVFDKHKIAYSLAKAWTTDAFFRETPEKVKRRLATGATVVDMECASVQAWSQFRQKPVYQFFYTADHVDYSGEWNRRQEERQLGSMSFFEIALKLAGELDDENL